MTKRTILLISLVLLLFVLGIGFGRIASNKSVPAHTIVYRLTENDDRGQLLGTSYVTRFQYSDGRWKNQQIANDARVIVGSGRVAPFRAKRQGVEAEMLGFKVLHQQDKATRTDFWVCPELNDYLKIVNYNSDGSVRSALEAIDVQKGEPALQ